MNIRDSIFFEIELKDDDSIALKLARQASNVELEPQKIEDINSYFDGKGILHYACGESSRRLNDSERVARWKEFVRFLLVKKKVQVNSRDRFLNTPLHYAAQVKGDKCDIVALLIDNGADINIENGRGESPLFLAIVSGNLNIAGLLVQEGALMSVCNMKKATNHVVEFEEDAWQVTMDKLGVKNQIIEGSLV
jgi:ankyrin repeat protein